MGRDWVFLLLATIVTPELSVSPSQMQQRLSHVVGMQLVFRVLFAAKQSGSFSSSGFKVCLPDDWVSCKKRANFVVRLNLYRSRVRWSFPELRNSIARDGKNFKRELSKAIVSSEAGVATVTFQEEINYNFSQKRIIIWCSRGLIFKEHKFRPPWQWYSND